MVDLLVSRQGNSEGVDDGPVNILQTGKIGKVFTLRPAIPTNNAAEAAPSTWIPSTCQHDLDLAPRLRLHPLGTALGFAGKATGEAERNGKSAIFTSLVLRTALPSTFTPFLSS